MTDETGYRSENELEQAKTNGGGGISVEPPGQDAIDFGAAKQFLTLFGANWTFQTYDDHKIKGVPKRPWLQRILHADQGNLAVVLQELARLNTAGACVCVAINRTDGLGRERKNIVAVNALFIDLDSGANSAPLPVVLAYKLPHCVVESSPGRFHCYWLVSGIAVEDFRAYQEALIDRFGSDPLVHAPPQAMRVPGFFHRKYEPVLTRIHSINTHPPYQASEFEKKPQPVRTPNTDEDVLVHAAVVRTMVSRFVPPTAERRQRICVGMAIHRCTGGSDEGYAIWTEWLASSGGRWSHTKAQRSWRGFRPECIGFGSIVWWANQAHPDWRDQLDREHLRQIDYEYQKHTGDGLYEGCGIATPQEQAAGAPAIKYPAPGLEQPEGQDGAAFRGACGPAQTGAEEKPAVPPQQQPPQQQQAETSATLDKLAATEAADSLTFAAIVAPPPPRSQSGLLVVRLADVPAEKVNWFWKERIARGMLSVFAGMPDVNKSTAFLDLAARATNGGRLPAGEGQVPQGSVIILTAEDTLANTVRPRLEVAGADLTRIHVIRMVEKVEGQHPARSFDLTRDIRRLEILIKEIGDVVLVGIDPVSAYMGKPGKLDSHRETDIRGTLMPLSEMAERRNVAIVGINHLNKNNSTEAMLRIVGSIAFVGGPRAAYFIVRDDEDDDRRLFLPVKNNISKIRTGLAFRVIDKLAPAPVFDAYPAIKWEEQTITMTADEALAAKPDGRKSEKLEAAKALIAEMLINGPQPATTIEERAATQGITAKSLRNAKAALFVRAAQAGGRWWWCLPGQEPPL